MLKGNFPRKAVTAAGRYLKDHPEEFVRALRNTAQLKVGLPLHALRYLLRELGGERVPRDLVLEARDSGIFVSASLDVMKTPLFGSAVIHFERVDFSADALLVEIRVTELQLKVRVPNVGTPIAALLQSGALNLSRPGDLVSYLPKRSPILVEARGDRFTLDLLQHPKLTRGVAQKIVQVLLPLVTVRTVRTADDHIDIALEPLPKGVQEALQGLGRLL